VSTRDVYLTDLTLDEAWPALEAVAARHGLHLDFLMRRWNGRFATFNLGRPTDKTVDVRAGGRTYRLVGRLKANTQPTGRVVWVLSSPTSCDPNATAEDEALFAAFRTELTEALGLERPNTE